MVSRLDVLHLRLSEAEHHNGSSVATAIECSSPEPVNGRAGTWPAGCNRAVFEKQTAGDRRCATKAKGSWVNEPCNGGFVC